MNEKGSKILFNKSSLYNLKAELLKKQEEVKQKKSLPQHQIENFKPAPPKPSENEPITEPKKSFKDSLQAIDMEEREAYKKTKAALEKKAQLYEHLSNPVGESQLASKYLVDFAAKKEELTQELTPELAETEYNDSSIQDDDDWLEFTDCLGRTRKCHKSDLELYKEKDKDLLRSIRKDDPELEEDRHEKPRPEKPFLVQKTNDYLQSLREKWEEKERELLAKDKDIHYQDLLFDEARMHGVSYYQFSTDENTRKEQMEELLKIREQTLREQKAEAEKRRQREDLVAARLKASRARQRLRAGLPAEDPEENQKDFNACLLEFLNKQKEEADARAKEEEKKIKEQIEKERQKLREAYVREWDRGKTGVEDKPKFKEMSQEEYVDKQRAKRIKEFAPLESASSSNSRTFDDRGRKANEPTATKTWADVRHKGKTPPPPDISDYTGERGLYFSSAKNKSDSVLQSSKSTYVRPKTPPPPTISINDDTDTSTQHRQNMKYRNFVKEQDPTPIVNELSDEESEPDVSRAEKRKFEVNHAEIAPPPTYDYYGPVPKHLRAQKPFESDMREAYAQGAKSLEAKASNRRLNQDYDFTFD